MKYFVFLKKEGREYVRTYRLLILFFVFLILGFLNPISAKYTPLLMQKLLMEGIQINMPEPSIVDAWAQFFKNVLQIGMIVLLIMYATLLSKELSKGTLINMLTKGLSRDDVILAKFTMAVLIWSLCYLVCVLTTYGYSLLFWESYFPLSLGFSLCMLWVFGIFLISLLLLGQTITKTSSGGLFLTALIFILCMFLTMFPATNVYTPAALANNNMALLEGSMTIMDCLPAFFITILSTLCCLFLTIGIFRKKLI